MDPASYSCRQPKAISIRGAGIDTTTIIDDVAKSSGASTTALWIINLALGKTFRLTGMTFRGQAQDGEYATYKGTVVLTRQCA